MSATTASTAVSPDSGEHKGIRTGEQYLRGLQDEREVWTRGKRVADVTREPGMSRGAATLASFLDRQHDPAFQEQVTYLDADGDRCAMAYQIPKTREDIKARGQAYYQWAKWSNGMFGRTPDYKNASLMAFAAATDFLAQGTVGQADFARNMTSFYEFARKNDKVLTHTLVNPAMSHEQAAAGKFSDQVALHVVKETDAGIVVRGARCLLYTSPSPRDS